MAHPWDDEVRELRLNQQAQGTILARMQFELQAHLEEAAVQSAQHARYVMDPENGAVVKLLHLQSGMEHLAGEVAANTPEARKVSDLQRRLKTVEDERAAEAEARKERRRWGIRDVLVPLLLLVVGTLLGLLASLAVR